MVTSQKEAFTGTVRVWGCQTRHPLRQPELSRNGAWGSCTGICHPHAFLEGLPVAKQPKIFSLELQLLC